MISFFRVDTPTPTPPPKKTSWFIVFLYSAVNWIYQSLRVYFSNLFENLFDHETLFYCEGFSNILCECQFIKNVFSDVLNFKRWEPSSFLYNLITYFTYSAPFFIVFILEDSFCYIIYAWMTFTLSKLVINST